MRKVGKLWLITGICCLTIASAFVSYSFANSPDKKAKKLPDTSLPKDASPEDRVRREIRLLDTLYKGGIVAITTHYVNDEDAIPAGTAFKQLFEAAESNGWHQVRLLDATDNPYNDENSPADKFEKSAVKKLVAGESWVEEIEVRDGVQHMRVATPIPVVFDKCVMCHDHYEDVKDGQAIGALSYTLPIDGAYVPAKSKKASNSQGSEK